MSESVHSKFLTLRRDCGLFFDGDELDVCASAGVLGSALDQPCANVRANQAPVTLAEDLSIAPPSTLDAAIACVCIRDHGGAGRADRR